MRSRLNVSAKYGNRKTEIDGIVFDSRKEAARYFDLCLLEKAGEISELHRQVEFLITPSVRRSDGKVEGSCTYTADFTYRDKNGNYVVEDTKGMRTKEYIIKRKLILDIFGIEIRET